MIYPQGKSFPPSGHGAGLIFLVLALLFATITPAGLWWLFLAYPSIWILFSKTYINTSNIREGIIIKKIGFFPFYFKRKIWIKNYDAAVIKRVNVKYRTTQSIGIYTIASQENPDEFNALSLKIKGKYDFEVLYKGTTQEINAFIKDNLTHTSLRFFQGTIKKELEIKFNKN